MARFNAVKIDVVWLQASKWWRGAEQEGPQKCPPFSIYEVTLRAAIVLCHPKNVLRHAQRSLSLLTLDSSTTPRHTTFILDIRKCRTSYVASLATVRASNNNLQQFIRRNVRYYRKKCER